MGDFHVGGIPMILIECGRCGVPFGMSESYNEARRKDHKGWYCPNGCCRAYHGKNEVEELQAKLSRSNATRDQAVKCCTRLEGEVEHAKAKARGHKSAFVRLKRKHEPEVQELANEGTP